MRTDLERRQALCDVRNIVQEWGEELEFFVRQRKDIKRGTLGTQVSHSLSSLKMSAYPIQRNPSEKQLTKAGLSETCTALVYTSALAWAEAGMLDLNDLILEDFDLSSMTVALDGREMKVSQIGFADRINNMPMYVTFALKE